MNEDERGDACIPKLRLLAILEYLGVPWASPSLGSCHSLFHIPSNPYQKLENFITQNSTENLISSISIKNKSPLLLLSYKPLHLEAQQRLQEEGCVVDISMNHREVGI